MGSSPCRHSCSSPVLHFGAAESEAVELTVEWPDGEADRWEGVETNRRLLILREREEATGELRARLVDATPEPS